MPSAHRIRLDGPWELEWTSGQTSRSRRIRLPADWTELFASGGGLVRVSRRFHEPTNLGPTDEVDLVFENWPGAWVVTINQHRVGEIGDPSPVRIAISSFLGPANVLTLEGQLEKTAGRAGQVALEIRSR
jgi:hypothetical protein